jgi:hypothetical protein
MIRRQEAPSGEFGGPRQEKTLCSASSGDLRILYRSPVRRYLATHDNGLMSPRHITVSVRNIGNRLTLPLAEAKLCVIGIPMTGIPVI